MIDMIIAVNKNELANSELTEEKAHWGKELFSYDPPRYSFRSKIYFEKVNCRYGRRSHFVSGLGDFVSLYCTQIYDDVDILAEMLLNIYDKTSKCVVFIYRDEEEIDDVYVVDTGERFSEIIIRSYLKSDMRGKIIVKKTNKILDNN